MSGIEQQPCCCGENLYPCCITCDELVPCITGGGLACAGYNPTVENPPLNVRHIVRTCAKSLEACVERGRTICGVNVPPTVNFNTEIPCVDGAWPEDLATCIEECNNFCYEYGCVACGPEATGCLVQPCIEPCPPVPNCPPEECCSPPPQPLCCCITIVNGGTSSWSCGPGTCTAPNPDDQIPGTDGTYCYPVNTCAGCDCDATDPPGIVFTCNAAGCGTCCLGESFNPSIITCCPGGITCGEKYPSGCNCAASDPCADGSYCSSDTPIPSPFCTGADCYITITDRCGCAGGFPPPIPSTQFAEGDLTKGLIVDKTGTMQFNSVYLFGYGEQYL